MKMQRGILVRRKVVEWKYVMKLSLELQFIMEEKTVRSCDMLVSVASMNS